MMKRARFTEEQIIGILQEHEPGAKCSDLCRKHGMSEGTFYAWKSKFGGMTVPDAKRLKALECGANASGPSAAPHENGRLKRLLSDTMLDMSAMRQLLSKKG
jgi:putative transposase